jgi:hypothetical protein
MSSARSAKVDMYLSRTFLGNTLYRSYSSDVLSLYSGLTARAIWTKA